MKARTWIVLIAAYLFAAFSWWGYLQLASAKEHRDAIIPLAQNDQELIANANQNFARTSRMIWMEGTVFLVVLSIALWRLWTVIGERLDIARREQQLLLSMTHELKTPIAGTKLALETLEKHQLAPEQKQNVVAGGLQEIARLDQLLTNVLLAARVSTKLNRKAVFSDKISSDELISQAIAHQPKGEQNRIAWQPTHTQYAFETDAELARAALVHVLQNALNYSTDTVHVNESVANGTLEIKVSDSGIGIPANETEAIFKKFYRASNARLQPGGTGLGLYIARESMRLLRGNIQFDANVPSGTTFSIKLPVNG